jgi:23S rRNA (cytosine1962-C5)-methyltransferase
MFILKPQKEYSLIDAGNGFKLEKYGEYSIARPDPQALWPKAVLGNKVGSPASVGVNNDNLNLWSNIDAVFARGGNGGGSGRGSSRNDSAPSGQSDDDGEVGNWVKTRSIPDRWPVKFEMGDGLPALNIYARLTPFKHTGIFPEQFTNWKWSMELIKKSLEDGTKFTKENPPKILNLFGYSGGATVAALLAGAHVTHVDSSKGAVTWANENAELAGVLDKPVRWILEDAVSFVKKEIRRGNKYDGIILDPPAFGRGAKGEVWKIEKDFLPFLELIFELLGDKALFLILNGYAAGYSSIAYSQNLTKLVSERGGVVEHGELCIEQDLNEFSKLIGEKDLNKQTPILLPCGIVARWKSN